VQHGVRVQDLDEATVAAERAGIVDCNSAEQYKHEVFLHKQTNFFGTNIPSCRGLNIKGEEDHIHVWKRRSMGVSLNMLEMKCDDPMVT
jgi:hypothetical protein